MGLEDLPSHEEYRAMQAEIKKANEALSDKLVQDETDEGIRRIANNIRKGHHLSPCYVQTDTQRAFIINHFNAVGWSIEFWTDGVARIKPLKK